MNFQIAVALLISLVSAAAAPAKTPASRVAYYCDRYNFCFTYKIESGELFCSRPYTTCQKFCKGWSGARKSFDFSEC